jgi:hypothetical protein
MRGPQRPPLLTGLENLLDGSSGTEQLPVSEGQRLTRNGRKRPAPSKGMVQSIRAGNRA